MPKSKKELVTAWLKRAEEDIAHVRRDIAFEDAFYAHLCFLLQQAAEKFLKAYITNFNLPFESTHDLLRLLEICKKKNQKFETLRNECSALNPFYIDTRYPVSWPVGYEKKDVTEGLHHAQTIADFVKTLLQG